MDLNYKLAKSQMFICIFVEDILHVLLIYFVIFELI